MDHNKQQTVIVLGKYGVKDHPTETSNSAEQREPHSVFLLSLSEFLDYTSNPAKEQTITQKLSQSSIFHRKNQ